MPKRKSEHATPTSTSKGERKQYKKKKPPSSSAESEDSGSDTGDDEPPVNVTPKMRKQPEVTPTSPKPEAVVEKTSSEEEKDNADKAWAWWTADIEDAVLKKRMMDAFTNIADNRESIGRFINDDQRVVRRTLSYDAVIIGTARKIDCIMMAMYSIISMLEDMEPMKKILGDLKLTDPDSPFYGRHTLTLPYANMTPKEIVVEIYKLADQVHARLQADHKTSVSLGCPVPLRTIHSYSDFVTLCRSKVVTNEDNHQSVTLNMKAAMKDKRALAEILTIYIDGYERRVNEARLSFNFIDGIKLIPKGYLDLMDFKPEDNTINFNGYTPTIIDKRTRHIKTVKLLEVMLTVLNMCGPYLCSDKFAWPAMAESLVNELSTMGKNPLITPTHGLLFVKNAMETIDKSIDRIHSVSGDVSVVEDESVIDKSRVITINTSAFEVDTVLKNSMEEVCDLIKTNLFLSLAVDKASIKPESDMDDSCIVASIARATKMATEQPAELSPPLVFQQYIFDAVLHQMLLVCRNEQYSQSTGRCDSSRTSTSTQVNYHRNLIRNMAKTYLMEKVAAPNKLKEYIHYSAK